MNTLFASALGPTPYAAGVALQEALVRARAADETGDWLLFPDHPPVLTVGRGAGGAGLIASRDELARRGIELYEASRGGDITWHGPGQLVAYPIVHLARCGRDLHAFLRHLEGSVIETVRHWGVAGERVAGRTGVWVGGDKLASLGIAVRRWVSYHGAALNVDPDLGDFRLIHPCGLEGVRMTSLAELLGSSAPSLEAVRDRFTAEFAARLGYDRVEWRSPEFAKTVAA